MAETRKTIFITGAGRGIGASTARLFAKNGWFVGVTDIDEAALAETVAAIGAGQSWHGALDVTDYAQYEVVAKEFVSVTGGRLDVLFNNAGILKMEKFEKVAQKFAEREVAINVQGVINGIYAFLDALKATPGAHIISMASASAIYGTPEMAVYSATKFAVRGLTEALNIEFAGYDINVSDIMPSYVNTQMVTGQEYHPVMVRRLGVRTGAEDVAQMIWKAAHGKRVHWMLNPDLRLLKRLSGMEGIARFFVNRYYKT